MLRRLASSFVILVLFLLVLPAVAQSSAAQPAPNARSASEALALPALRIPDNAPATVRANLSGGLQPDVVSPLKYDTSPALQDIRPDSASAQLAPREIPLLQLPKFSKALTSKKEKDLALQSRASRLAMPQT